MGTMFDDLDRPKGDTPCPGCHPTPEVHWAISAADKIRQVQRRMIRASVTRSNWLRRKRALEALACLEGLMEGDYTIGTLLEETAFLRNLRDSLEWLVRSGNETLGPTLAGD
jgi:hypothetical protein